MRITAVAIATVALSMELSSSLIAQSFKQVRSDSLPTTKFNGNVTALFIAQSGRAAQVVSHNQGIKGLRQGSYKNLSTQVIQQRILLANDKFVALQENETFVGSSKDHFFTGRSDYQDLSRKIGIYKVDSTTVRKVNTVSAPLEGSAIPLENGVLIVSDESEGYGTTIKAYSNRGNLILTYSPYDDGFKHAVFTSFKNSVIGCLDSGDGRSIKLIRFDTLANSEEFEIDLNTEEFDLTTIVANYQSTVVYGFDKLIAFDEKGKVKWKRGNVILPHFNMALSKEDKLFFATQQDIFSVDLESGTTNWRRSISDLYDITPSNQELSIRPIAFKLLNDGNSLAMIMALAKRGSLTLFDTKYHSELIVIGNQGDVLNRVRLEDEVKRADVLLTKSGFVLIDGSISKEFEYEK